VPPEWVQGRKGRRVEGMEGNFNGNYMRLIPEQNELIGDFKMAAGNIISTKMQVMEYTYIPTGIKRELVRSGMDCNWKG
jgi:hypothetical protein